MGVVHKLQDEVRDFILAEKKTSAQISCRKLSEVVFEKFHIVVSKSSISSILKSANLNSPVGRHSFSDVEQKKLAPKIEKKFKIPQQKKNEIFPSPKTEFLEKETLPVEKDTFKPEDVPQKVAPPLVLKKQKVVVPNAGAIFFNAVQWKLAGDSILAKVLKEEMRGFNNVNFDEIAQILLFSEIDKQQNHKELENVLAAAENITDWGMKLAIEIATLLQTVSLMKMVGADNAAMVVDLKNSNVQSENVQFESSSLLTPLLQRVEKDIVKNVHSAVFHCPAKVANIENLLQVFLSIFAQGKMKEIVLYDSQLSQLVGINHFLPKSRTFVLAISSWEKIFPRLVNSWITTQDVESLKILDKTFFYKKCQNADIISGQGQGGQSAFEAIALSHFPTERPFIVLVTNAAADQEAVKNTVEDFLVAWPKLMANCDNNSGTNLQENLLPLSDLDQAKTLLQSVQAFKKVIQAFSQQYFFVSNEPNNDVNISDEKIYELSGFMLEEKRIQSVSFNLAQNDSRFTILKNAINRFNSQVIFDPHGRRVVLEIHPTEI